LLMEQYPVPVLMLSQFTHEGADLTLKALQLGAMDFVDKSSKGLMDFLALASEIVSKIKTIAHIKPKAIAYESRVLSGYRSRGMVDVVAIGASTGGPPALGMILQKLPRNIGFGLLIVQHMPRGFTASLAQRFDSICAIHVKEAEDLDRIEPGLALIAPSGSHMKVTHLNSPVDDGGQWGITLDQEPSRLVHKPSADVLFQSVAETYGSRSMGVILTGMGSDGAKGLKAIKDKGALTLAQDEATSVIFGMPRVAISIGAVDKIVPLTDMAEEIMRNA
ncbi:MAG TPA: chemotaxis-specific protein-glutamate methyltransferase CheB, partial [Nitrospirota bacterium]|nr:chemotaxis-specific protein-glutamate methyltransferase CheB [Nitrospirota bacterium]